MARPKPRERTVQLDDQLCFALYAASRAMTARYRVPLAALTLTYPQYLVVVLLLDHGRSSIGYLGERLHLDSSTLSPVVKRLAATGLVTRTRDLNDERSTIVELTARGQALRPEVNAVNDDICAATEMDADGRRELVAQLRELTTALEDGRPDA